MDSKTAVDPISNPVQAKHTKTELEPSAPAIIPVKLSETVGSFADSEAGASLGDFLSFGSDSKSAPEPQMKSRTDSTDGTTTQESESGGIRFAADAEAGVALTEIIPERES